MIKFSRLKRVASISQNDYLKARVFLKRNPQLVEYFPSIAEDIANLRTAESFKASNKGLAEDLKCLVEIVNYYRANNIEASDQRVPVDYSDYINNRKTAQSILESYTGNTVNIALSDEDVAKGKSFLSSHTVLNNLFPNLNDLLDNKKLIVSDNGLLADLSLLNNVAINFNLRLRNGDDATKERIQNFISTITNDLANNSIADIYDHYFRSAPKPQTDTKPTSLPDSPKPGPKIYTKKQINEMNRKNRSISAIPRKHLNDPRSAEVVQRIKAMLKGMSTEKTRKMELTDVAGGIELLYKLRPDFKQLFAQMDVAGYPHFSPSELENEIISLIKFAKFLYENNAFILRDMPEQVNEIFNNWLQGQPLSSVKPRSKAIREAVEYAERQQTIMDEGKRLLEGPQAQATLRDFGFILPEDGVYKQFYDNFEWLLNFQKKLEQLKTEKKLNTNQLNLITDLYIQANEIFGKIQDKIKALYDRFFAKGRKMKYINELLTFWHQDSLIKQFNTYKTKAAPYARVNEGIKVDSHKPTGLNPKIWNSLTPKQRADIHQLDTMGAVSERDGLVLPLALLIRFYSTGHPGLGIKSVDDIFNEYDTKIAEFLTNDDLAGAIKWRTEYLNQMLDDMDAAILKIQRLLAHILPPEAIRNIDDDRESSLTWLSQNIGKLRANINRELNLSDKASILTAQQLFAALLSSALVSAGERVWNRPDKTKEDFIRKIKDSELRESNSEPYSADPRGVNTDKKNRTPDYPYNDPSQSLKQIQYNEQYGPTLQYNQTLKNLGSTKSRLKRRAIK